MLQLGRLAGVEHVRFPNKKKWMLVTTPHRGMASALFALGFMEAITPLIIAELSSLDLTKLNPGDLITWRRTDNQVECGVFIRYSSDQKTGECVLHYRTLKNEKKGNKARSNSAANGTVTNSRLLKDAIQWHMSPYFGKVSFTTPRQMSNNLDFFKAFFPASHFELLCNTTYAICLVGRPALWNDLRLRELSISGISGCIDDLLRIGEDGENPAGDVSHYLTRFISPDRDELELFRARCCVFDGSQSYPKLKNFIQAPQNLVLLDRWENGSINSVNTFVADSQHAGVLINTSPTDLDVPSALEYAEWSLS